MLKQSIIKGLCCACILTSPAFIIGCGFHLRGYDTPMSQNIPTTRLIMGDRVEDIALKRALKAQFAQLAIKTDDPTAVNANNRTSTTPSRRAISNDTAMASVQVSNIHLQTYQLRGLLTEIRMVMTADVTYKILQNGEYKTHSNKVQVQRSYQYDQATVATDNPQAEQIKVWLYDNLAQRITDEYMALNLPRKSLPIPSSVATTTKVN